MRLVNHSFITQEEQYIRALLAHDPLLFRQLSLLVNRLVELVRISLEEMQEAHLESADVALALVRCEETIARLGIPLVATYKEWEALYQDTFEAGTETKERSE